MKTVKNAATPPDDFGRHGAFLEESVKHILKHDPEALAFMGVLKDGEYIGAYDRTSVNDKLLMAGNILIDVIMDVIRNNAVEIGDILDSAEESCDDTEGTDADVPDL